MDRLIVGDALSRSNVPAGFSPRTFLGGRDAWHPWVGRGDTAALFEPCPSIPPGGGLEGQGSDGLSARPPYGATRPVPVAAISARSTG